MVVEVEGGVELVKRKEIEEEVMLLRVLGY